MTQLPTIDLTATDPRVRGTQYGEAARAPIERSLALTTGSYQLTPGLPCSNSYQQVPWNLYDGPGPEDRPDVPAPIAVLAGR